MNADWTSALRKKGLLTRDAFERRSARLVQYPAPRVRQQAGS